MVSESDTPRIRIKSKQETLDTLRREKLADRGFLSKRGALSLTVIAIGVALLSWKWAVVPLAVLAIDYTWFVVNRARLLRRYNAGTPCLRTPEDFAAISDAYEQAGSREPSMTDWNEVAGFSTVAPWHEELRYRTAAAFYRGGKLLDVGCGDGRLCWRYKACVAEDYIGVDPGRTLLQTLSEKTSNKAMAVEAVAEDLRLPNDSVDLVICSECFEHLPEPWLALREFDRVLKSGGQIVIQSPNALRLRNLNPFHLPSLLIGYWWPAVLLRQIVDEHTFVAAFTYHWDFTRQDFQTHVCQCPGLTIQSIQAASYRFNPQGSKARRILFRIFQLPVIHWLGWDLTVVLGKGQVESQARGTKETLPLATSSRVSAIYPTKEVDSRQLVQ